MKKRVTRPSLERNTPVRTWSTLFGPIAGGQGAPGKGEGAAPGAMNAVQKGVEFAYRVSDEYIKQGQAFAKAFSQPFAASAAARNGGSADLPQLTERMFRYTSELSTMWMEGLRMMSGNAIPGASPMQSPPPPPPWAGAEAPAARPAAPPASSAVDSRSRVTLQIDSKLPTRATIDLHQATGRALSVGELRLKGGKARIRGVRVEEGTDGLVTVVIRVPARQAPGTYQGEVVDSASSAPVGTVTVRVSR